MAKKKVKGRQTSARYPKGYTGPTDTDMIIERPRRKPPKPPKGPKATKGTGKGSVGFSNGKRPSPPSRKEIESFLDKHFGRGKRKPGQRAPGPRKSTKNYMTPMKKKARKK